MDEILKNVRKVKAEIGTKTLEYDGEWREFYLRDLFRIEGIGKELTKNIKQGTKYPLIIAKKDNNGCGILTDGGNKLFSGNKIVMIKNGDGGAGLSYYQEKDFYATSSIMILKEKFELNKNIGLFLITQMKDYKKIFSHNNGLNEQKFNELKISLPTKNNEPDLEYMNSYIADLKAKMKLDNLVDIKKQIKSSKEQNIKLDTTEWQEFKIGDIFNVLSTKTRELTKYGNGNIPFISGISINNGVEKYIFTDEELEKGNCISVSSIDCSAFYQSIDFIGRGHGVIQRLYNNNLNKNIALFICPIIKQFSKKYNYNNQCWLNNLKQEIIKLPTKNGEPDWEYMDKYITTLKQKIFL